MTGSSAATQPWKLHFPRELESAFQRDSYDKSRNFLRGASALCVLLGGVQLGRWVATAQPRQFLFIPLTVIVIWSVIFGLTFWPGFWRCWQPVVLALLLASMTTVQTGVAQHIQSEEGYAHLTARVSWFSASTMMFMIGAALVRLSLPWATLLYTGLAVNGALTCLRVYGAPLGLVLDRFSLGVLVAWPVLVYLSYTHEKLQRDAYLAQYRLAQKEAAERSRRQQTESMLQVLSQAIGGIVHDLGNPLTLVQSGAATLEMFISAGDTDPATLAEFLGIINSGAQMLGYLRLSLMEQTRVLQGTPIPVDLKPVLVRAVVEAGARYQKPKFTSGRRIVVEGEDVRLLVDEMKLVTVFMNLIGNALKYSDGEVLVTWRRHGDRLLIAVQDQGWQGRGLSPDQAAHLFVAFGRLETHSAIEGTGLGLLSVQKIIEAHGGETFVEGRTPGGPAPTFSTAPAPYSTLLEDGFCTAFVVACLVSP